jgi:nucleoside 2-deoxyribosyltransferase
MSISQLTKDGFEKYQHLQNQFTKSKKVFVAMQFDQNQNTTSYQAKNYLDMILREEFDLELFSMEHNNQLGNIIEVMKAEINDAKFIICDLSDGNRGAYWEAGYAEGQKKKVIYICDEEIFDDEESRKQGGERKIHFDIKQTRIIKFDFSSKEKIQIFKKEISSSIKASGLNIY